MDFPKSILKVIGHLRKVRYDFIVQSVSHYIFLPISGVHELRQVVARLNIYLATIHVPISMLKEASETFQWHHHCYREVPIALHVAGG